VGESGQDLAADVERVAAVRDALGPDGRIRVDVNAAWDVESAVLAIARLDTAAHGLEYVEQPCRTLDELRELRRGSACRSPPTSRCAPPTTRCGSPGWTPPT
jgi:o-succinylbenzoate synthase